MHNNPADARQDGRGGHQVASALCALCCCPYPSLLICHLPSATSPSRVTGKAEAATTTSKQAVHKYSNRHGHGLLRGWVPLCAVQYGVCRWGFGNNEMCASCQSRRQSCSRTSGQRAGQEEAHRQGSEHSTSPRAVSFFDGDRGYVPMYPRTQSPPAHLIPHLALGSTTTRPDRRRAHSQRTGTYLGQPVRRYMAPPSTLYPHTAAQAGCVTAMFPAHRPRAPWEVFLSRSWPRQITALQGSCGYSGTNARGTSGPRTWVAPAHPLLMPSLRPPLLPTQATCDRAWQAMAEH